MKIPLKNFLKKIRFFLRLIKAFVLKRASIIFLGVLLGFLFYHFSPFIFNLIPKTGKILKIGVVGKYSISEIPSEILSKISLGLTKISEDGNPLPDLCDRWEISLDEKIYTFYFEKKKHFWHDGSEFSTEDVNYNFKDAKILSIDSHILKIILNEPFSPLPIAVSQPIFKKGLIGLGNYKVKKLERSGQIIKSVSLIPVDKKKDLPSIVYRFYVNESHLITAFKLGEINKIEDIQSPKEFEKIENIKIGKLQRYDRFLSLFFNTNKDPFSEKSFRQAISYAIEKPSDKTRCISPVNPLSWAFNPGVKRYEKDLVKSKQLLSKLKIDKKSPFLLYVFPSLENEAKKIQAELKIVGIESEIRLTSLAPDDFDMFLAIQKSTLDPDQYSFWHTGQPSNLTKISNPRIDKLLEDGRKLLDQEERKKIYFDFQRFLVEESPAVFLYYPFYYSIERA